MIAAADNKVHEREAIDSGHGGSCTYMYVPVSDTRNI